MAAPSGDDIGEAGTLRHSGAGDKDAVRVCDPDPEKHGGVLDGAAVSSSSVGLDLLSTQGLDPALELKMHLVNNAMDEIGWTPYHLGLFLLSGFGYSVDSMAILLHSIVSERAYWEFNETGYRNGLTVGVYAGMMVGAVFWGLSADMMGRRISFNVTLLICAVATVIAGSMPNWPALGVCFGLVGFGGGGNLICDTSVLLEYLPGRHQWVVTLLGCWWGVGQAVAGLVAWGFLVPQRWNCKDRAQCATSSSSNNKGWRYVLFAGGGVIFVMSVLRVTVVRLRETPKYQLGVGREKELVDALQGLAAKYNRKCSLTVEKLEACGGGERERAQTAHTGNRFFLFLSSAAREAWTHTRGLFATRKLGLSTVLVWLSWSCIGVAYPLFQVFLPRYMRTRGAEFKRSDHETWRNYALINVSSIAGPVVGGVLCNTRALGRRWTMVAGALLTGVFFLAYTAVSTPAQDVVFACLAPFALNIYYGTLFAYTAEVLPSAHRTTGNGIGVALNRAMGIVSAGIETLVTTGLRDDDAVTAPIYVCAALYFAMAAVSACFPFEPRGKRSS